eukprot:SM000129S26163  [mRNA]  locus=s129:357059:357507:+ [translate_table: standard]
MDQYPELLTPEAIKGYLTTLPADIQLVGPHHLRVFGQVDLVDAGWEWQGHSSVGAGGGLADHRSRLFWELERGAGGSPRTHVGDVPAGDDRRENVRRDFQVVESRIGRGVPLDAAALGSRAHRLQMKWTNLTQPELVELRPR